MADFTQIIQEINDDINTNGVGAITGAKLNEVLRDMIAAVNAEKQDPLTIDATPTEDSTNPVQSGGVYEELIKQMIADGAIFGGFVGPSDPVPFGTDYRYFYIANEAGTYVNFNGIYSNGRDMLMFLWDGSEWYDKLLWTQVAMERPTTYTNGNFVAFNNVGNAKDSGKKSSDFATAAQGTKADTAYQKPSGGIPKTDLASGVQTSLGKADTAFQKPSGGIPASDLAAAVQTSLGKADTAVQTESDPVFSASPAAGITSGDIADWDDKADPIPVVDASTIPASMDADKVYKYGTLSGDTTFPALNIPTDLTVAHVYCWTFTTPATAPTITWPSAITSWAGGSAPTINASKSYEVSVMDGIATIIEA